MPIIYVKDKLGRFVKGFPHNKGLKRAWHPRPDMIGKNPMKGKKHTENAKEKNRLAHLGKEQSAETIIKRMNHPNAQKGKNHWNWHGGISQINRSERMNAMENNKYRQWRKAIFKKDDYRCFDCGERGGKLEADHIYPWSLFPRLRYEIDNGQTVCKKCHQERTKIFLKYNWRNQFGQHLTTLNGTLNATTTKPVICQ